MREVEIDPLTFEIGQHVVEINKLVSELNREARNSYKPNYEALDGISTELKHHAIMIQRICDWKVNP